MSTDLQSLIDYYVNLLILQYQDKPKAKGTIALLSEQMLCDGVIFDIRDGFNIDTAVGVQLDTIGKWAGVDRKYFRLLPKDGIYFGFKNYDDTIVIDEGFTDYTHFSSDTYKWLNYDSLEPVYVLNDDEFRFILKLKILQNNLNHTYKSIDDAMLEFFGTQVVANSSSNVMTMIYYINPLIVDEALIAFKLGVLPRPMGVGLTGLIKTDKKYFGFKFTGKTASVVFKTGFKEVGIPKTGQILVINDILQ